MAERLVLERDYRASPERVFAAWSDPATVGRWFGCGPGMLWTVHEWDCRPGGKLRVSLDFPDGPYVVEGEFVAVEPPHHLRYRWQRDEYVDVRVEAHGTGARLRLEHTWPQNGPEGDVRTGGWTSALDALGTLDSEAVA